MAKTPIGATSPYATPADFIARIDVSIPGLLVRDDQSQASPTELLTDPNLAAALADASGLIESVVLQAEMYDVSDLQALTGNSLALLKRIVVGIAVAYLRERRGIMEPTDLPIYKQAIGMLEAIQEGTNIFAFAETASAGLPDVEAMKPSDFYQGLPTLSTNQPRYWGIRSNRRPWPGQG